MAQIMHPEQSRQERFIEYAAALRERFAEGLLSELQPLNQWVVWKGELEDGKRKKVPYNPHQYQLHARSSVKIPKSWGTLEQSLRALESGNYSGIGFMVTPPFVFFDLDHTFDRTTGTGDHPIAQFIYRSFPKRDRTAYISLRSTSGQEHPHRN